MCLNLKAPTTEIRKSSQQLCYVFFHTQYKRLPTLPVKNIKLHMSIAEKKPKNRPYKCYNIH